MLNSPLIERSDHFIIRLLIAISVAASLLLTPPLLHAQQNTTPPIFLQELSEEIVFDGRFDDLTWKNIKTLPLTMYEPVFRGQMTEKSEIKVAYDDNYLYAAGRFSFENIDDLRSNSLTRDNYKSGDTFGFVIDPYNDNENAIFFWINPDGTRFDAAVSNDADITTGNPFNPNFNTFWDAKTEITEEGWTAEMRIPLTSLGFQVNNGEVSMGIITYRYMARKNERHIFPDVEPKWAIAFAKPSQMQDVIIKSEDLQNPVYFTPYVLNELDQQKHLNANNTEYLTSENFKTSFGADLKYNISTNLSLEITLNTDFAQAEVDDQQINLSRFSLFFPEKRQFFQERAGIFDFSFGGPDRLFFSRRIGLDNTGDPITIYGGTRVIARKGKWDIGLIDMQTKATGATLSENFGLLRFRRQVINQTSYVGGIVTSRLSAGGNYNVVYGLDGLVRISGNDFINVKWSQTFDDEISTENQNDLGKTGHLWIDFSRRQQQGFGYGLRYARAGEDFDPEVGFLLRRNFTQFAARTSYGWFFNDDSPFRRGQVNLNGSLFRRNATNDLQSGAISTSLTLQYKSGGSVGFNLNARREDLLSPISFLPGTQVAAGDYSFYNASANFQMPEGKLFRLNGSMTYGSFYDGNQFSLSVDPTWNVSKRFELGSSYLFNQLKFSDRGQQFNAHIIRLRVQYSFNEKISVNNFVQFSNIADLFGVNFRFRYNFAERNDLWVVYNSQINTDRTALEIGFPRQPLANSQALLIKYTYTFAL